METESSGQVWRADLYERNARFVPELGQPVVALLAPRAGERILDLGCGDGVLTESIAQAGASVLGVDAAPDLIAAARKRGIDAQLVDAHALPFDGEFDAVFSNAALHWMTRPDDVIAGVRRALKPGGRFVAECGGHGNVAAVRVALTAVLRQLRPHDAVNDPWYFPHADEYARRLTAQNFTVEQIALIPRPTLLPTGMAAWLETFAGAFFAPLSPAERETASAAAVDLLAPALRDADDRWFADYVRLRFVATRR
jgi:SAM-dependent methyltransferase